MPFDGTALTVSTFGGTHVADSDISRESCASCPESRRLNLKSSIVISTRTYEFRECKEIIFHFLFRCAGSRIDIPTLRDFSLGTSRTEKVIEFREGRMHSPCRECWYGIVPTYMPPRPLRDSQVEVHVCFNQRGHFYHRNLVLFGHVMTQSNRDGYQHLTLKLCCPVQFLILRICSPAPRELEKLWSPGQSFIPPGIRGHLNLPNLRQRLLTFDPPPLLLSTSQMEQVSNHLLAITSFP